MRSLWVVIILAVPCLAQTGSFPIPSKAEWTATPGLIRQSQSKYPTPVNINIYLNSCKRDSSGKVTAPLLASDNYSLTATGSGVNASVQLVGDCTITAALSIDSASVQPGNQFLIVSKQPDKAHPPTFEGAAVLGLMDTSAGPTPSIPEVDVLWDVISQHICSDSFGNHVPKYLYCIELKIGNNSSHQLQLAGVGFKVQNPFHGKDGIRDDATLISPNIAYQTTRSMLQAGGGTTARNLIYKSIQSIGLIMASFTPYFHNDTNKAKWSTGAAIVSGAFVQSIDMVAPDLTVRELGNLDDQAFRDGKLIPNNTQVRMIVFVDKGLIAGSIKEKCTALLTTKNADGKDIPPAAADVKNCSRSNDPTIVKILLGDLVLVGDMIEYIQRVVVDPTVTSQEVNPAPTTKPATKVGPAITLSSQNVKVGDIVTITGSNFGASQGSSTVTFNGVTAIVTAWGDSSIMVKVPAGATKGDVVVTVGDVASKAAFTVN